MTLSIETYSEARKEEVKGLVLEVLNEKGFNYDPVKDSDLDDVNEYYSYNGGTFFTGIIDGKVIGTSAVRRIDTNRCEIRRIYVKKEFRGNGFGTRLFKRALEFALAHYGVVFLKTDRTLVEAINMYKNHGFSIFKEEDDIIHFRKHSDV